MGTREACNTRCQSFYIEMLQKESSIRIKWFLKNQKRLLEYLEKPKSTKETKRTSFKCEPEKQSSQSVKSLRPLPRWRPLQADASINIDNMKPIDPQIRAILYEKDVPSSITSSNYTLKRVKESPENRYYFPDCTSWVYGWRLKDYPPVPRSKVGMKSVLLSEFYHPTASSLQRDDEWYQSYKTNALNCN